MDKEHLTRLSLIRRLAEFDLPYRNTAIYAGLIIEAIAEATAEDKRR